MLMFILPIQTPPTIEAAKSPESDRPYKVLLDGIAPPPVQGGVQKTTWKESKSKAIAVKLLAQREIERLEEAQKATIEQLKNNRPQMEADLRVPEVASLRDLLDDPVFFAALKSYNEDRDKLFAKEASDREDERVWMSQVGIFVLGSEQENLNATGRPGQTRTVTLPGTEPSEESIKRIDRAYAPIWNRLSEAVEEYGSRVAQAESRARQAAPGATTDAAARIIQIRMLRLIYNAATIHLQMLYHD
jgi:hypothetical protein